MTKPAKQVKKTSAEIAAELEARRTRIAGNISAIQDAVRPARMLHKTITRLQGLFPAEAASAGSDKIAGLVSSLVGLVGLSRVKKD